MTNLMLHDIEEPNIKHDNSLSKPLREYSSKDMIDVVKKLTTVCISIDGNEEIHDKRMETFLSGSFFLLILRQVLCS